MQNRPDAFFKQIARDSEYSDRGAAVSVAKHLLRSFFFNLLLFCGKE